MDVRIEEGTNPTLALAWSGLQEAVASGDDLQIRSRLEGLHKLRMAALKIKFRLDNDQGLENHGQGLLFNPANGLAYKVFPASPRGEGEDEVPRGALYFKKFRDEPAICPTGWRYMVSHQILPGIDDPLAPPAKLPIPPYNTAHQASADYLATLTELLFGYKTTIQETKKDPGEYTFIPPQLELLVSLPDGRTARHNAGKVMTLIGDATVFDEDSDAPSYRQLWPVFKLWFEEMARPEVR